ncbi:hypothetical protein SLS58_006560 [Diplodia intermedia]|uniref:Uncharacterized protein n=1 Tax=Diplodia intermedia TaxID=856260 RepID=A0ABR3TMW4_9PEZI
MSDTQRHLQQDLGPDAAAILSRLADSLEGKCTHEGLVEVDDVVFQQLSELKTYHEVQETCRVRRDGKRPALFRSKPNATFRITAPVYFVPMKIESVSSSISTLPKTDEPSRLVAELKVGSYVYIAQTVRVALPLDMLLLKEGD